jgi:hypothetical protein
MINVNIERGQLASSNLRFTENASSYATNDFCDLRKQGKNR